MDVSTHPVWLTRRTSVVIEYLSVGSDERLGRLRLTEHDVKSVHLNISLGGQASSNPSLASKTSFSPSECKYRMGGGV
jgi:hypothetical protein